MSAALPRPSVLIIGAGMYVCGRGTPGFGTILPAVVQAHAQGLIGDVAVAATSSAGIQAVREKLIGLNARLGTTLQIKTYPPRARDAQAYRKALAELPRPGCAIVAVPDHLHAEVAAAVIEAGLHVLVVKPLAPTVAEVRRLIALARTHQVYGAVDFHKRFDEANLLLRQALRDGRLGALRQITVEYSQRRRIRAAFGAWIEQTNIFQYLGVHYVDLIAFVTGARPVRVLATGQPKAQRAQGLWQLDAIQATVEWQGPKAEDAFVSLIATNWAEPDSSPAMSNQAIRVLGTRGRLDSDQTRRGVRLVTEEDGVEDVNPYFSQLYDAPAGAPGVFGYGPRSIQQFLTDARDVIQDPRRIAALTATRPSFEAALASTAVVEAVNASLAAGETWITVDTAGPAAKQRRTPARAGTRVPA